MRKLLVSVVVLLSACGGKKSSVTPGPEVIVRPTPTNSAPEEKREAKEFDAVFGADIDGGTPVPQTGDAGICCPVRFAVKVDTDVVGAKLIGMAAPLTNDGGVQLMSEGNGVWAATVCMPNYYDAQYLYEVQWPPAEGDGGVIIDWATNPNAPIVESQTYFTTGANQFDFGGATSCAALDAGVHGLVTAPDAGI